MEAVTPPEHILNTLIQQSSSCNLCIIITITIIYTHMQWATALLPSHNQHDFITTWFKNCQAEKPRCVFMFLLQSHTHTNTHPNYETKCYTHSNKSHPCFQSSDSSSHSHCSPWSQLQMSLSQRVSSTNALCTKPLQLHPSTCTAVNICDI